MNFTFNHEFARYGRQITIDRFGTLGQKKLRKASVLIAGAGGLGNAIAIYLAAAGTGKIGIVDHDSVELTNLNRQILYSAEDVGRKKTELTMERIKILNPEVEVIPISETIIEENALHLTNGYDLIIDALDNFLTRYILNNVSLRKDIPLIHGAVKGLEGRVTTLIPGETPCLRCIYPKSKRPEQVPVLGVTAAVVGSLQATEAIKYIVGFGVLLTNRLLIYDGLHMEFMTVKLKQRIDCKECKKIMRDN